MDTFSKKDFDMSILCEFGILKRIKIWVFEVVFFLQKSYRKCTLL